MGFFSKLKQKFSKPKPKPAAAPKAAPATKSFSPAPNMSTPSGPKYAAPPSKQNSTPANANTSNRSGGSSFSPPPSQSKVNSLSKQPNFSNASGGSSYQPPPSSIPINQTPAVAQKTSGTYLEDTDNKAREALGLPLVPGQTLSGQITDLVLLGATAGPAGAGVGLQATGISGALVGAGKAAQAAKIARAAAIRQANVQEGLGVMSRVGQSVLDGTHISKEVGKAAGGLESLLMSEVAVGKVAVNTYTHAKKLSYIKGLVKSFKNPKVVAGLIISGITITASTAAFSFMMTRNENNNAGTSLGVAHQSAVSDDNLEESRVLKSIMDEHAEAAINMSLIDQFNYPKAALRAAIEIKEAGDSMQRQIESKFIEGEPEAGSQLEGFVPDQFTPNREATFAEGQNVERQKKKDFTDSQNEKFDVRREKQKDEDKLTRDEINAEFEARNKKRKEESAAEYAQRRADYFKERKSNLKFGLLG